MSESTPTIGDPQDTFALPSRADRSLSELVDEAKFDDVHFFFTEALEGDAIDVEPTGDDVEFALLPYEHPTKAIDDDAFDLLEEAGYQQATVRDVLNFAIERPNVQREYEIVALGTLRTRRVYEGKAGETVWNQTERDKTICQWATGLSNLKKKRTFVPFEIYLDKVLRKDTLLLVRKG